ncbi:hypothetical protein ACWEEL_38230, partial [Streptomyces sp. NPDC005009]
TDNLELLAGAGYDVIGISRRVCARTHGGAAGGGQYPSIAAPPSMYGSDVPAHHGWRGHRSRTGG